MTRPADGDSNPIPAPGEEDSTVIRPSTGHRPGQANPQGQGYATPQGWTGQGWQGQPQGYASDQGHAPGHGYTPPGHAGAPAWPGQGSAPWQQSPQQATPQAGQGQGPAVQPPGQPQADPTGQHAARWPQNGATGPTSGFAVDQSTQLRPSGPPQWDQPPPEHEIGTTLRTPQGSPQAPQSTPQPPAGWEVPAGTSIPLDSTDGPPPGSVGWLQQQYPAPPSAPVAASTSPFAPGSARQATAPAEPVAEPTTRRPRLLLFAWVAVVLLVLVVVLAIVFGRPTSAVPGPQTAGGGKPSDGAKHFMEAVAAGDAKKALSFQVEPASSPLLTDEVLKHSQQQAPITQITVTQDTDQQVELSYHMGGEEVRAAFTPVRQSNGSYKISRGTSTVQVDRKQGIPMIIGGVPVQQNELVMFPGTYLMETRLGFVTYEDPQLTISGPTSFPHANPTPRLTDEGRAAFLDAARRTLDGCMKAKDLNPPDCPQRAAIPASMKPDLKSVRWTLRNDPVAEMNPMLNLRDLTQADADAIVQTHISANVEDNGSPGRINDDVKYNAKAFATITGDSIQVSFRAA